jgi:hypothetical protein
LTIPPPKLPLPLRERAGVRRLFFFHPSFVRRGEGR